MSDAGETAAANAARRRAESRWILWPAFLFGSFYFVQGIGEPADGLLAQPVRSLLRSWGRDAAEIGTFAAVLAVPWALKPLYGLLTDFVPLCGSRRRSYLLLASAGAAATLGLLYVHPPGPGSTGVLLAALLVPAVAIAFCDVVIDALMIEVGQERGAVGRLQSIQWGAMYSATIVAGIAGGHLSQTGTQRLGLLVCAAAFLASAILAWRFVREPPAPAAGRRTPGAGRRLVRSLLQPSVLLATAFLFLWNFNPFSAAVLDFHMTRELGFSESFCGARTSLEAAAAVAACAAYGVWCRRLPFAWLLHASVVAGILSTLLYWALASEASAIVITLGVGTSYMLGVLIQLDLVARVCPAHAAGTTFALVMAISNLAVALSQAFGGWLYEAARERWSSGAAFAIVVGAGALATACTWAVVPAILRRRGDWEIPSAGS